MKFGLQSPNSGDHARGQLGTIPGFGEPDRIILAGKRKSF